jgi:hypothetical protein
VNPSIIASLGAILIAAIGAITSFIRTGQAQKSTSSIESRKVEGSDFDRITREQRQMIEDLRAENHEIREQNARQQEQLDQLRIEVAECEEGKSLLVLKVTRLQAQIEGNL